MGTSKRSGKGGSQRNQTGRRARLELLEDRLLLSFDPSPLEQEMLENINRMRTDPQGELDVLFSSLNPLVSPDAAVNEAIAGVGDPTSAEIQSEWESITYVQPVAWHEALYDAALGHNEEMIRYDEQSHQLPGEPWIAQRAIDAGYVNPIFVYENVSAYADSVFYAYSDLVINWGDETRTDRNLLMGLGYHETGISVVAENDPATEVGSLVVTVDYGTRFGIGYTYLLGVAYDDLNGNGRYDAGEGQGNVDLEIVGENGIFTAATMTAGGYQLQLSPGIYTVIASGGDLSERLEVQDVEMKSSNVKVDLQVGVSVRPESAPVAGDDAYEGDQDSTLYVPVSGVLGNDTSPDGKPLTVKLIAPAQHGTVTLDAEGSFTYVPQPGFFGTDVFYYRAEDPTEASNTAKVFITVNRTHSLSIDDVRVREGDSGSKSLDFTVSLSPASDQTVTVNYATANGSATAASDFTFASGSHTFTAGQTSKTVSVVVSGDVAVELHEAFYVDLSDAIGATIDKGRGIGTILNDDGEQIGLYDANATFNLKNDFASGGPADNSLIWGWGTGNGYYPIAGDWDGDGIDTIGLYSPTGVFSLKNDFSAGAADISLPWGDGTSQEWLPIAGDWDGDGIDTVGLYAPNGVFLFKNELTEESPVSWLIWGLGADDGYLPVAGDWDGDTVDTIGLYDVNAVFAVKNDFSSGGAPDDWLVWGWGTSQNWLPIVGDWNQDGFDTIGLYDSRAVFHVKNDLEPGGVPDNWQVWGWGSTSGYYPIAGDWDGRAGSPLLAAGGPVTGAAAPITQADLQPIVSEAIADWAGVGLGAEQLEALLAVDFIVMDLPGAQLGLATLGAIYLDINAAGHGWFVDPTPTVNEEFQRTNSDELLGLDPEVVDRMDLLTVVSHELGHTLGLADLDSSIRSLMSGSLETGLRREPGASEIDAVFTGL